MSENHQQSGHAPPPPPPVSSSQGMMPNTTGSSRAARFLASMTNLTRERPGSSPAPILTNKCEFCGQVFSLLPHSHICELGSQPPSPKESSASVPDKFTSTEFDDLSTRFESTRDVPMPPIQDSKSAEPQSSSPANAEISATTQPSSLGNTSESNGPAEIGSSLPADTQDVEVQATPEPYSLEPNVHADEPAETGSVSPEHPEDNTTTEVPATLEPQSLVNTPDANEPSETRSTLPVTAQNTDVATATEPPPLAKDPVADEVSGTRSFSFTNTPEEVVGLIRSPSNLSQCAKTPETLPSVKVTEWRKTLTHVAQPSSSTDMSSNPDHSAHNSSGFTNTAPTPIPPITGPTSVASSTSENDEGHKRSNLEDNLQSALENTGPAPSRDPSSDSDTSHLVANASEMPSGPRHPPVVGAELSTYLDNRDLHDISPPPDFGNRELLNVPPPPGIDATERGRYLAHGELPPPSPLVSCRPSQPLSHPPPRTTTPASTRSLSTDAPNSLADPPSRGRRLPTTDVISAQRSMDTQRSPPPGNPERSPPPGYPERSPPPDYREAVRSDLPTYTYTSVHEHIAGMNPQQILRDERDTRVRRGRPDAGDCPDFCGDCKWGCRCCGDLVDNVAASCVLM